MKNSLFADLSRFKTVSFDIDGTVYPIRKVQMRWWKNFFLTPYRALRFYEIKKTWEKRRKGSESIRASQEDILFFEEFLTGMLSPDLVPGEIRKGIRDLGESGVKVYFLSDHGAKAKLSRLGLSELGSPIDCLTESGELKPHEKISALLRIHGIAPESHLHLGDRWTDEEQARLFGCEFRYMKT